MDFEITAELMELIDSVRSVLVQECPTALVRDIVEKGGAPEQPWNSARELNWTSIDLPEGLGGLELGLTALGLVIEQHGCCIAPGPFLGSQTLRLRSGPGCRTRRDRDRGSRCARRGLRGLRLRRQPRTGPWMKRYLQTYRNTISAGTSEIQRIAPRVLGLPRR